jgi:hypothetical protein
MSLTERHIELAARQLCRLRGIDPEQVVSHGARGNGMVVEDIMLMSPAWKLRVGEVRAYLEVSSAVLFASEVVG